MINQIDNALWFKLNGFLRILFVKGYVSPLFHTYVVTEHPKSGGTWLSQILSSSLDISYPRNRLPQFRDSVIHGCFLKTSKKNSTIVLYRDGRDSIISYYYHILVKKPRVSEKAVNRVTSYLGITDIDNIERNLPIFIDYCFSNKAYPRFTWSEFARKWHNDQTVIHTSYEALSNDPASELIRIINEAAFNDISEAKIKNTVAKFSFENQAKRKRGQEDSKSFLRKGIVGDWKNVFSHEARELFDYYAGNELILLGYEKDHSWIRE